MEFKRKLDLNTNLNRKSAFLLGPRSLGKSWLHRHTVKANRIYNLLEARELRRLVIQPSLIFEEIQKSGELIVIDEIQKIPDLLNEVHRCIEEKGARFLLTGSSARTLKRSQANLLGGRAAFLELFPLTWSEIDHFDLVRYLNHGGIPRHYLASDSEIELDLEDYVSLYLKEEIKDEAVTRNLEGFSRFLEIMALHSGDELAIESFASDCGIKAPTFRNYLEVLKDTLIGFEVPAFTKTKNRKAISRSKFFLFDLGVTGYLSHRSKVTEKNPLFGKMFEQWIALELRAALKYHRIQAELRYWRSTSQFEVDFVVGQELAIEVKATERVTERMLSGLNALAEEKMIKSFVVVSRDPRPRKLGQIEILPYEVFLERLWSRYWM